MENRFMASMYLWISLIPVVARLIQHFPHTVIVAPFAAQPPLELRLGLPFSWYFLYFSAMAFSLARLVYVVGCPDFLRRHTSAADVVRSGATAYSIRDEMLAFVPTYFKELPKYYGVEGSNLRRLVDQLHVSWNGMKRAWEQNGRVADASLSLYNRISEAQFEEAKDRPGYYVFGGPHFHDRKLIEKNQLIHLMSWDLIRLQDSCRTPARLVVTISILLGLLLFGWTIIQNFIFVVGTILN